MTSLIKNTIYYSLGEVIPRLLSFIILPILTAYLTPKEYGINSYIISVMAFMFVLSSLSLNTFVLSRYYRYDEDKRKELIGSVFLLILFLNIILSVVQILFFPLLINQFNIGIPFYPFLFLAILNNFFDVISIIPLVIFRVKEDARGFLIISLLRTILQYILILVLVVHFKLGLEGSFYGRLLANIPFAFIFVYYLNKSGIWKINWKLSKAALKFSLPLLPGSISYLLISLSDRVILERYISLDKLGIYSVAITLTLVLNIIIQALYKTFEPVLFKEFDNPGFHKTNDNLYRIYLFALYLGGFGVALFSKEIFYVTTSGSFRDGYEYVNFLIIPVIISGINTYLEILMTAGEQQKKVSMITIMSGLISIAINLLLIPYYGIYGAIVASSLSFLVANAFCHKFVKQLRRQFFGQSVCLIFIIVVPYVFNELIQLQLVLTLIVKVSLTLLFGFVAMELYNLNFRKLLSSRILNKGNVK